jgi:hypothetical protein
MHFMRPSLLSRTRQLKFFLKKMWTCAIQIRSHLCRLSWKRSVRAYIWPLQQKTLRFVEVEKGHDSFVVRNVGLLRSLQKWFFHNRRSQI